MSATRRTLLAGLATLPAAAIPALASPGHDAVLIEKAAALETLARQYAAALQRGCDLENEAERLVPLRDRPKPPPPLDRYEATAAHFDDGGIMARITPRPVDPAAEAEHTRQTAACEAWEAKRSAANRQVGCDEADRLCAALYKRIEAAAFALAELRPTTMAGVLAKARVFVALDPNDDRSLNDWETDIVIDIARDLLMIAGGAG